MTVPITTRFSQPSNYKLNTPRQHQIREGSREHVIWWNGNGRHCSGGDCEINQEIEIVLEEEEGEREPI